MERAENHGAAISQYVLTMCKGSSCDPSDNTAFLDARYMCAGSGTAETSLDLKCCGRNENNGHSTNNNFRCNNPGDSKLAPVGTPFEVAYDLEGLDSGDEYCPGHSSCPSTERYPNGAIPTNPHDLDASTDYRLVVRAMNSQGIGWASNTLAFTTKAKPTMKPSSDFVIEKKAVTLKWNAYDAQASGTPSDVSSPTIKYEVEVRSAVADEFTDNPKEVVRSDANPPLTWDTGTRLFAGRQYFAKVRAFYPVTGLDASTGTESIARADSGASGRASPTRSRSPQRRMPPTRRRHLRMWTISAIPTVRRGRLSFGRSSATMAVPR